MKSIKYTVILGILVLATVPAFAAIQTANVTVNASVAKQCAIQGVTINLGAYDTFTQAAVQGTGNLQVRCTKNAASVTISLATDRVMSNGAGGSLNYTLTQDGGAAWNTTDVVSYTAADSSWFPIAVDAEITANQDVPDGSYTDTVVATINY